MATSVIELNVYWWLIGNAVLVLCGMLVGIMCEKADRKPELRALHRYQVACALVWRWNGQLPNSAETAEWIMEVGEGKRPTDIEQFRERLRK